MSTFKKDFGDLVYSTEHGRMCPPCNKPVEACTCRKKKSAPKGDGIVRVGRETKGRKGKGMTVITGVPLPPDQLRDLGKELKKQCGTGGTVKNGVIEIQGDHRDALIEVLKERGWTVKRTGG
ncbi:MAG: translation initiation factor Sui1 [Verrucomicrobiota bacterium]